MLTAEELYKIAKDKPEQTYADLLHAMQMEAYRGEMGFVSTFEKWPTLPDDWQQRLEKLNYTVDISFYGFYISWLAQ